MIELWDSDFDEGVQAGTPAPVGWQGPSDRNLYSSDYELIVDRVFHFERSCVSFSSY